ncbi:MAG TPA: ABC transporter ATP-binding protein [Candidatus Polarisedimenticolia bacterium]|nr:ABC transporter ATP-binding protein [Candidatus Polarisedimenticolia bacterium]
MPAPERQGDFVIQVENLTILYGKGRALDRVTAGFPPGAVGLLGPNGAGKSSLLKTLLGFLKPDQGSARVLGMEVAARPLDVRQRVGYMPEIDCHIPGMNAVALTSYLGELCGMPRIEAIQRAHEALYYAGLGDERYRNVETYSTGMKQRIKLAQALVHGPKILFLDEPTNGLDPKGRMEMLALIRDLARRKGVNVVLSSHLLRDVEETCTSVVMLSHGRVVGAGSIESLKGAAGELFEVRVKGNPESFLRLLESRGCTAAAAEDGLLDIALHDGLGSDLIFAAARDTQVQVRHLVRKQPTLEDVFARAVGERVPAAGRS